jgi:TPR repeat protein
MKTIPSWLAAALLVCAATACKSKIEKCNDMCAKIKAEDESACAGDKSCLADVEAKHESCRSLCDAAVGEGKEKRESKKDDEGEGTPADKDEKKCEKDDAEACANTGGRYLLGKDGRSKDEKKGAALLDKACKLGSAFGCEIWGRALDDGRGVPVDKAGADAAWTKACDKNQGGACRSLALRFATSDPKRIPLLEKACGLDDGIGCMGLGAAFLHGNQGAPKNLPKAKEMLGKACKLGQKSSCEKVAEIP